MSLVPVAPFVLLTCVPSVAEIQKALGYVTAAA